MATSACAALACLFAGAGAGAEPGAAAKLREPLPLEVAVSVRKHNSRSPINFSPDGLWIAHTIRTDETVPRTTRRYSATGFPLADGDSRTEATLTDTKTGEMVRLGGARSSSWAAVWSPDGRRVAFYSDEGGEAGVWIWERATRKATRFPGVVARPDFGFEVVRWSADGQRLLCKVLPAGMRVDRANAMQPSEELATGFPKAEPGKPSVVVRRSDPKVSTVAAKPDPAIKNKPEGDLEGSKVDLAVLHLTSGKVTRLVENAPVRFYAFSPDQKKVAYAVLKGWESNSQQANYDLAIVELQSGARRTVAADVRMGYGIEWSWAPDGRRLAYITGGSLSKGQMVIVPVEGGEQRVLTGEGLPSFDPGDGEYAPVWDTTGESLYAAGDGKLWRVDAASGRGTAVGTIPDWRIRSIVMPFGQPTLPRSDAGRGVWVLARHRDGGRAGFYEIDLSSGSLRPGPTFEKAVSAIFNLDMDATTGEIAFVATDQQSLPDIWAFDPRDGRSRRVSQLNEALDRYELGLARLIEWRSLDGEPLKGALLLPPGHQDGQRLPLVVWVYSGSNGAAAVNRFGLADPSPVFNLHVLATRGYAVLFPDAPLRAGRQMTDLMRTVMPGVDAAIDQGYADPDRLAVMGQSYGSYCALAIIAQTRRFKAAVITGAIVHPDLFADYLESIGSYEQGWGNMKATIWQERDRYLANSPLFLFDQIETPLLIGIGEKDRRPSVAAAIFAGLQRLNKPVEHRLYEGEGHVITQRPNVLDFWNRRLEFLAEHLDLSLDGKGAIVFDGARAKSRRDPTGTDGKSAR